MRAPRSKRTCKAHEAPHDRPETSSFPSLKDRVVIITGAGQGIGRAFAKAFADGGRASPSSPNSTRRQAAAVSAEIMKAGGQALAVTTDVADPASIEEMVEIVEDEYGRIDVLINNAAHLLDAARCGRSSRSRSRNGNEVLKVNITGPLLCARAVLPAMRRAKWGRIINMSPRARCRSAGPATCTTSPQSRR